VKRRQGNGQGAFAQVSGGEAVLTAGGTAERLRRKGYGPVLAPESLVNAAGRYGLQSPAKVLSADDRSGREVPAASPDAQAAVDLV
jgi:hypothetical protein